METQTCKSLLEMSNKFFSGIRNLNEFQNNLPSLGKYIFFRDEGTLKEFYNFTVSLVSDFYNQKVYNISLMDLANFGAMNNPSSLPNFYVREIQNGTGDLYTFLDSVRKYQIKRLSTHPCKNEYFAKFCNMQTNEIMANNLDRFFKIMLLSSTLYTNSNVDVLDQFLNLTSFREKFKTLNFSFRGGPKWPIISSCFHKSISGDLYPDCKILSTTLTPLGICSSFNALSHHQIYAETEHSRTWTAVINEKDVNSMFYIKPRNFV